MTLLLSENNNIINDTIKENEENEVEKKEKEEFMINIYRYKFIDNFTEELYRFSKIHEYDNKNDFKDAWKIWIEDNNDIICEEVRRVTNLGYNGDVISKMFKSARYYFRKKTTEKKEPIVRRNYIGIKKEILDSMDKHIQINIIKNDYKPANAFHSYCNENTELLKEEIKRLLKLGLSDHLDIKDKIKKTYKNRYFLLTK
jgi:hypothetical protein